MTVGSTGYSRDDAKRRELAEELHTVADLIESKRDFGIIRAFVEPVLSDAIARVGRPERDALANAVFDTVLDVVLHTCVVGETYCYICEQTREAGAS
jgi:hypothetical protein